MIPIILRTIRDRWKMLLAVTLIGVGTMLMYVSLFPSYQDLMKQNTQLFEQMPEALKQAFNMDSFSFDTLEKFLNIEMYSLFFLILAIVLTISLASNGLAGEVERETIVLSAGQPISRRAVFTGKFLAAVIIFTIFNILLNASVFPFAAIFHLPILAGHFLMAMVMCELFGLALIGVGFAVSAFMSDKGKVQMIVAGAVMLTYTLNIVSSILPSLNKLKYLSFFHYFNPNTFLVRGDLDPVAFAYYSALVVVGFFIGLWRWSRRDFV